MTTDVRLVEIKSRSDALLLPWLDLYETAFPAEERVLVSRLLEGIVPGETRRHMLAAVDDQDNLTAILYYADQPEARAAFLWYFAVVPELRGQGLGARLYQAFIQRLSAGEWAVVFDVESPAEAQSPEQRDIAERRIQFYRRQGAFRLSGVRYVQRVGLHQPEITLYLMIHPLQPLSAQQAFDLAHSFLPEALSQTGVLRLV